MLKCRNDSQFGHGVVDNVFPGQTPLGGCNGHSGRWLLSGGLLAESSDSAPPSGSSPTRCYVGTALTVQTSLGYLLTQVTLRTVPALVDALGWAGTFPLPTVGPAAALWSMPCLRGLSEAAEMASVNR